MRTAQVIAIYVVIALFIVSLFKTGHTREAFVLLAVIIAFVLIEKALQDRGR